MAVLFLGAWYLLPSSALHSHSLPTLLVDRPRADVVSKPGLSGTDPLGTDPPEAKPKEIGLPSGTASRDSYPCGDVCRYDLPQTAGSVFPVVKKAIDCPNIMSRLFLDKPAADWPPPNAPPADQLELFTQNGEMPVSSTFYFQQRYSGAGAFEGDWTVELVEDLQTKARNGEAIGWYDLVHNQHINNAMSRYPVTGKVGAVIGSEAPWVEALVLNAGAKHITTLEYGVIKSRHPNISTMIPHQAAEKYLTGKLEPFDFIMTYSSQGHSGLGRYGESLNPFGDLEASAQAWCMLKPGGIFFLGLPVAGTSHIRWNADRNYGPERMREMGAGFEQLGHVGGWSDQSMFILRKPLH